MNRRLPDDLNVRSLKRYKTADTKIANSNKLPHDFFSSKRSLINSSSMSHKKNTHSLPTLKKEVEKANSL